MVISSEKKYIFIHIPKNAGTSIEASLTGAERWDAEEKHLTSWECREKYGSRIWQEYFTFCVVRNPWDRLVSQFNFSGENWCNRYFGRTLTFSEYVAEIVGKGLPFSKHDYLSKRGAQPGDKDWRQLSRVTNEKNEIIVDFVARFENLEVDYQFICDKIGLPGQLQHINHSPSEAKPYWDYYNDETANIVATVFAGDVERFGYTFGQ